jgi:hypothetical protein
LCISQIDVVVSLCHAIATNEHGGVSRVKISIRWMDKSPTCIESAWISFLLHARPLPQNKTKQQPNSISTLFLFSTCPYSLACLQKSKTPSLASRESTANTTRKSLGATPVNLPACLPVYPVRPVTLTKSIDGQWPAPNPIALYRIAFTK